MSEFFTNRDLCGVEAPQIRFYRAACSYRARAWTGLLDHAHLVVQICLLDQDVVAGVGFGDLGLGKV